MERWLRTQGVMDCPHVREGSPGPPTDGTQCHSHAECRMFGEQRLAAGREVVSIGPDSDRSAHPETAAGGRG